ncbi:hypothetical protein LCGC14_1054670 [marine sediment metagenome]|uniref:Uncharacterized protein n=1 Tax=marine sediment metagenome TaxID=412755 RepID=A0A0F9MMV7_9ZZZZ
MKITYREFEGEVTYRVCEGIFGRDMYTARMTHNNKGASFIAVGYNLKNLGKEIKKFGKLENDE